MEDELLELLLPPLELEEDDDELLVDDEEPLPVVDPPGPVAAPEEPADSVAETPDPPLEPEASAAEVAPLPDPPVPVCEVLPAVEGWVVFGGGPKEDNPSSDPTAHPRRTRIAETAREHVVGE